MSPFSIFSEKNSISVDFKFGPGYKPSGRFENSIKNYRSNPSPNSISHLDFSGFNATENYEFFLGLNLFDNFKAGICFGNTFYKRAKLKETTSDPIYTLLSNRFKSEYLFLMGFYTWNLKKKFYVDLGGGIGVNQTIWKIGGYSASSLGLQSQSGYLSGSGLSYRLDALLRYKIDENISIIGGVSYIFHTVPSFRGSINGDNGSFMLRYDGSVAAVSTKSSVDSSIYNNGLVVREIDMASGNVIFFIGTGYNFYL